MEEEGSVARGMTSRRFRILGLWWSLLLAGAFVAAAPLERISLVVGDQTREALVAWPTAGGTGPHPLVIAFHGHGGSMEGAAAKFQVESLWPEAVVAYPQGLPIPGGLVDPAGKLPGWQLAPGQVMDRDLAFFDALLAYLGGRTALAPRGAYLIGHSNGAVFAYLLWAARPDRVAAIAPIAGLIPPAVDRSTLRPLPVFLVGGTADPLVRFAWQEESLGFVLRLDGCDAPPSREGPYLSRYGSRIGVPCATYIAPGGHEVPPGAMAPLVDFLKALGARPLSPGDTRP